MTLAEMSLALDTEITAFPVTAAEVAAVEQAAARRRASRQGRSPAPVRRGHRGPDRTDNRRRAG